MGLLEFNKLPINTLVGADWKTFKAITAGRDIDAAYKGKYRLTKAVCRLLSPLAALQDKRYEKLLANQPLEHDSFWDTGGVELLLYITCSPATSILGITQLIRPYSRI